MCQIASPDLEDSAWTSRSVRVVGVWFDDAMTSTDVPDRGLELRSTLSHDGIVTLAVRPTDVPAPGDDQVVVRVDVAPINPSDLGMMFAAGDIEAALALRG